MCSPATCCQFKHSIHYSLILLTLKITFFKTLYIISFNSLLLIFPSLKPLHFFGNSSHIAVPIRILTPLVRIDTYIPIRWVQIDTYMHHKTDNAITFSVQSFCNENFHKCSSYLDTVILKASCNFDKTFSSNHLARPRLHDFIKKRLGANSCYKKTQHFSYSFVCIENVQ